MAQVSHEEFVKAWMSTKTNKETADKLGVSPAVVYNKAQYLRDKGVNLPKHQTYSVVDVEALNALISLNQ